MITKVVLAKLSPTMEEGTIVKWSKKEGDAVKVGDVLAEIETDKANMEMEALGAGVLRKILVPAGGKAPVGALIGVIADAGRGHRPAARGRRRGRSPARRFSRPFGFAGTRGGPRTRSRGRSPGGFGDGASGPRPRRGPGAGQPRQGEPTRARHRRAEERAARLGGRHGPGGRIVKRDIEGYLAAPPAAAPSGRAARPGASRRPRPLGEAGHRDPAHEHAPHDREAPHRERLHRAALLRDRRDRHGRGGVAARAARCAPRT